MSLASAFQIANIVEAVLDGKQQFAPILADAKAALNSALKVIEAIEAINDEVQAARSPAPPPPAPSRIL